MTELYLWINSAIYLLFALWCTMKKKQTSRASGYLSITNSGWSEYLVIYGGLQLGLGLFFAYLALNPALYDTGLIFAFLLYFPVFIYRAITIYRFRPVKRTTLVIAAMEILLLLGAIISSITFSIK